MNTSLFEVVIPSRVVIKVPSKEKLLKDSTKRELTQYATGEPGIFLKSSADARKKLLVLFMLNPP
jgi:hypothetical protein